MADKEKEKAKHLRFYLVVITSRNDQVLDFGTELELSTAYAELVAKPGTLSILAFKGWRLSGKMTTTSHVEFMDSNQQRVVEEIVEQPAKEESPAE